jgi:hypothetical protein
MCGACYEGGLMKGSGCWAEGWRDFDKAGINEPWITRSCGTCMLSP